MQAGCPLREDCVHFHGACLLQKAHIECIVCSMTMHNKNAIYEVLPAGNNAGLPGYVQEHLHQASLVLQPKTDLSSRVKLASRLLSGLCSSMAGSKCKQVLYLPAVAVKNLKVYRQSSFPCMKLHICCAHILLCKPSNMHACCHVEMQYQHACPVCDNDCGIYVCMVAGLKCAKLPSVWTNTPLWNLVQ